jgi:hypothetical protein
MLNPWGDIITIARASCVTKDWGYLTIGVQYGDAKLPFNAGDVKIRSVIFTSQLIGGSITKVMAFNDRMFLGQIYIHD